VTFRHDEIDLPVAALDPLQANGPAENAGTGTLASKPSEPKQRERKALFQKVLQSPWRGLLATWIVAGVVSGAVSLVFWPKVHVGAPAALVPIPELQASPAVDSQPVSAVTAAAQVQPTPVIEAAPVETLPVTGTGRWDSHVAVGRGDLAWDGARLEKVKPVPQRNFADASPPSPASKSAAQLGAISAQGEDRSRRSGVRAEPRSQGSVLDAPIAPPED
jgi:hypothetical protein